MKQIRYGTLIADRPDERPTLRTDLPAYLYVRRSTRTQQKVNLGSKLLKDDEMESRILQQGFSKITKVDIDDGKSAQKHPLERDGIQVVLRAARAGTAGCIAAFDASRLYRDKTGVYYNTFIQEITPYNVPVILAAGRGVRVYWPSVPDDMKDLRKKFDQAQEELGRIENDANPAKLLVIEHNASYGGHAVPMGYVVVGEKKNKHYAIYRPHADLIVWLFKRYKALNGNLSRLGRELVQANFHFPPFDKETLFRMGASIPHVALPLDDQGYRLSTRNALVSILSNPCYLGFYLFDGVVVSEQAHDPIIEDRELFMFAYTRHAKYNLDGSPNEIRPVVERHYAKVGALLEGILTSNGIRCYPMSFGAYMARRENQGWKTNDLTIPIELVDNAITQVVHELLYRYSEGKQDRALAYLAELQAETSDQALDIGDALTAIESGIKGWNMALQSAIKQQYQPGIDDATKQLKKLNDDKRALEAKAEQVTSRAARLQQCCDLFEGAVQGYNSMPFEKKQLFVKLLVVSADITEASPHILALHMVLAPDLFNRNDVVMHIFRVHGPKPDWTEQENAVLRRLYPHADRAKVTAALPIRTWESIRIQAGILKVMRDTRQNTGDVPQNMTHADVALLRTWGIEYPYNVKSTSYIHAHWTRTMVTPDSHLLPPGSCTRHSVVWFAGRYL